MATPADLEDFATGFLLAERLAETTADIVDIDSHETVNGIILRAALACHTGMATFDEAQVSGKAAS